MRRLAVHRSIHRFSGRIFVIQREIDRRNPAKSQPELCTMISDVHSGRLADTGQMTSLCLFSTIIEFQSMPERKFSESSNRAVAGESGRDVKSDSLQSCLRPSNETNRVANSRTYLLWNASIEKANNDVQILN